jgi:arsenate reductase (glutaredoxin)
LPGARPTASLEARGGGWIDAAATLEREIVMPDRASVDVYGLPYCTTCQKALNYLEGKGVSIRSFRNLKEEPLSRAEVEELARKTGGAEALFSKRAMKYRAMGLHEQTLSEDDLLRLMTEEYTFVTRPVIVRGDRATAGWAPKRVDELVG